MAGRSEVDFTYSVGFDDAGRISVLDVRRFHFFKTSNCKLKVNSPERMVDRQLLCYAPT